jgi:nicotinate-nucleotide--dimethylbenzimidazole phosphoribosyltransferase
VSAGAVDVLASAIEPLNGEAMDAAQHRLDSLTKPPGSLGRLESIAVQLAGIRGVVVTRIDHPAIVVFAADHGITRQGVAPYPSAVTRQMLTTFASGRAAINVLAAEAQAELLVVDVGVVGAEVAAHGAGTAGGARVRTERVRAGTADFSAEPAMTTAEALAAVDIGARLAAELVRDGCDLLGLGEMGIGNTTASSAIVAALLSRPAIELAGAGTGLDPDGIRRKAAVVDAALARHRLAAADPLLVLATVGGLEIAALVGAMLGAASARVPVVLDGFITGAAALVASRLAPELPARLVASHRSAERGHAAVLASLGLEPILDLGLRLGEGSGAALAIPVVRAAAAILGGMATFEEAGVTDRD